MNDFVPNCLRWTANNGMSDATWLGATGISLISVTVVGTVVVLAAILLQRMLQRWLSVKFMYLLWTLVILRFVLVWVPASPTSVLNFVSTQKLPAYAERIDARSEPVAVSGQRVAVITETLPFIGIDEPIKNSEPPLRMASNAFSPLQLVLPAITSLWLLGFAYGLLRLTIGGSKLAKLIKRCKPVVGEALQLAQDVQKRIGVRRHVRFLVTDELSSPAMTGVFRPIVFLTRECFTELSRVELEMVLAHELTHIRRWDGVIQLASHLISSLHWFNPLVRIATIRVALFRELSCDAAVIDWLARIRPNVAQDDHQREYGSTILKLARFCVAEHSPAKPPTHLLIHGFINAHENDMKKRITMLIHPTQKSFSGWLIGLLSLAAIGAFGFTAAQPATAQEDLPQPLWQPQFSNDVAVSPRQNLLQPPVLATNVLENPASKLQQTIRQTRVVNDRIRVSQGETKRVSFDQAIPKIMVSKPEYLNAVPIDKTTILFTGLNPGLSSVNVTLADGKQKHLSAEVICDVRAIQSSLDAAFPKKNIKVIGTPSEMAILRGTVENEAEAKEIETLVNRLTKLVIVNQLAPTKTIALNVKVFEVSRKKLKAMGIDAQAMGLEEGQQIERIGNLLTPKSAPYDATVLRSDQFEKFLSELEKHGVAILLDQPTLVARTGQAAEFLSGGEVPLLVKNQKGENNIEFRPFGLMLKAEPVIIGRKSVTLDIKASFSEIDNSLSGESQVPGFRIRRVNTGVELQFGQAWAIAGNFKRARSDKDAGEATDEVADLVFIIRPRLIDLDKGL